jgi:hypothetical protein
MNMNNKKQSLYQPGSCGMLYPRRLDRNVFPKRRLPTSNLRRVTPQKSEDFHYTALEA